MELTSFCKQKGKIKGAWVRSNHLNRNMRMAHQCMRRDFAFLSCHTTFRRSKPWLSQLNRTDIPILPCIVCTTTYQSLSIQCKGHRPDYISMRCPLLHQSTRPYIPYPQHSIAIPSCDIPSIRVKLDTGEKGGTVMLKKLREAITHSPYTHCLVV